MRVFHKKAIAAMTMLLCGSMAFAQSDDPVIMTIAGHPVQRSEFEYSYNKNNAEGVIDKKTVDEYVDLFINYKLKVQAALDAKLDTMKSRAAARACSETLTESVLMEVMRPCS